MKKIAVLFSGFGILVIVGIYILIPARLKISKVIVIESSERILLDHLNTYEKRKKWWPGEAEHQDTATMKLNTFLFHFSSPGFNTAHVEINDGHLHMNSVISFSRLDKTTMEVAWMAEMHTGLNPVKKVMQYLEAKKIKSFMNQALQHLGNYLRKPENVYGIKIKRGTVKDTLLLTREKTFIKYPTTAEIYNIIQSIKYRISAAGLQQTNFPMLNVHRTYKENYQVTVSLPVNKLTDPGNGITLKRMVAGNILIAEITGGKKLIEEGFNQLNLYLQDFKLVSPAMPYEQLVTNRLSEPDSSKWKTRLYYPIF